LLGFAFLLNEVNRHTDSGTDYDSNLSTIRHNLHSSWVVDNDPFRVNQLGHPYQGSMYHAFARSAGLDYWESLGYVFGGSALWEIAGERTTPSRNDQINTGIGGSFLGEILFRLANIELAHDNIPPFWREAAAAVISPATGFNRLAFGDRFKPLFPSNDPVYFSRLQLGFSGTTQNDILKEYIARGTWIFPPRPSMRLVTDIFEFGARELPRWNTISISGYHMREAGASAAQELAFTLADGIAYVEAALARGLEIDEFAPRLSFFFAAWSELFEEVAKFRAARRMWARIVRDRFGASNIRSMMCRFHVQTAGSSLTAQSVDNNVVRTTIQALSAVLGGAQSLHTNARDEALALPTEESARLALRTQQIIAYEAGVTETPDPLAGSYFVETLTDELESAAQGLLDEIEAAGGTLPAIESGFQQRQIQESAYRVQTAIERGDQIVVGVNRFRDEGGVSPTIHRIDPEGERRQIEGLRRVRADRDPSAWEATLARVEDAARGTDNLLPPLVEAVKAYATVGEISDRLRAAWGIHRELVTI